VDRRQNEIAIIDIALLPAHRNHGIGTWFLHGLMAEANNAKIPVRIHVEQMNPALRLYQRLGFVEVENQGIYLLMEYRPVFDAVSSQPAHLH
jgi:ribosomal protein S18 acetylase RimI-like enzyme